MSVPDTPSGFWDDWNRDWRIERPVDGFMQRQLEITVSTAQTIGLRDASILDVGCGTGWLGSALLGFGRVYGTDMSPDAIADGLQRYPEVTLICGNFLEVELPGPFDFVVSADALVHMGDYEACVQRFADLVRPGGTLLLMTQNPKVWRRRSSIRHVPQWLPHWSPEDWPTLDEIRALLDPSFTIERTTSLVPGGDRGLLWWVENRYVRWPMDRLLGRARWQRYLENAGLGRDLVIDARRR